MFTALLQKRLEKWTAVNNILPNKSLGFRKGLRTEDGIFILTTVLNEYAKRTKVSSCSVNFADSINQNLLFLKLAENGISGNFYFLLKSMYMNHSYATKVSFLVNPHCPDDNQIKRNNSYQWYRTTLFKMKSGLKQGRI